MNLAVFLWADQLGPIGALHEKRAFSSPTNQLVGPVGLQAKLKAPAMLQSARGPAGCRGWVLMLWFIALKISVGDLTLLL